MPKGAGRAQGDEHARDEIFMARHGPVQTATCSSHTMTSHIVMLLV
jgi:hypothetical protein